MDKKAEKRQKGSKNSIAKRRRLGPQKEVNWWTIRRATYGASRSAVLPMQPTQPVKRFSLYCPSSTMAQPTGA